MKQRRDAVNRVLDLQRQRRRLAEWKLIALREEEKAIDERQRQLVRFLEEDAAFSSLFATTLMKRLRGIAEAKARLVEQRAAQEQRLLEEVQRVGRAERLAREIEIDFRRHEERAQLAETIETSAAPHRASLP